MCLIAFALGVDPRFPLVLAANRDEHRLRPTAPMAWWAKPAQVLAGRDLQAGGTWLGLHRDGRIAALTNIRHAAQLSGARSRGELVLMSLAASAPLADLQRSAYAGFNLLGGDLRTHRFWIDGNHPGQSARDLAPGLYGLSNGSLDEPWPKTLSAKAAVARALAACASPPDLVAALLHAFADKQPFAPASLPDTGVGAERELALSPLFIDLPHYGTRSSTVVVVDAAGMVHVTERSFDAAPPADRRFQFSLARAD